ncbi:hypothetical protein PMIN02_012645 [Paraphaeosphaeria minitans]
MSYHMQRGQWRCDGPHLQMGLATNRHNAIIPSCGALRWTEKDDEKEHAELEIGVRLKDEIVVSRGTERLKYPSRDHATCRADSKIVQHRRLVLSGATVWKQIQRPRSEKKKKIIYLMCVRKESLRAHMKLVLAPIPYTTCCTWYLQTWWLFDKVAVRGGMVSV